MPKDKDKALYYLNKASKSEKIKKLPAYYSSYLFKSFINLLFSKELQEITNLYC